MSQKLVVALGGNAILSKDATAASQQQALIDTARALVQFVKNGDQLIVSHGNGPQVGNLLLQQQAADSKANPAMPLDTCVAMTEGSIGYWLQQALHQQLNESGLNKEVVTLVTQVEVAKDDPAFTHPTKPIGPFLTEDAMKVAKKNQPVATFKEDAGRGYRKVVPSPMPIDICEKVVIKQLVDNDVVTISAGGGGIPVYKDGDTYKGVEAVIDKDFASEKLAELVEADTLLILTAVDHVYIHYNQPDQQQLTQVTVSKLEHYIENDEFAAGSMLPKVKAAMMFVKGHPKRRAVITSLDNVEAYIAHGTGTIIIDG